MESRSSFPTVDMESFRGTMDNTHTSGGESHGPTLRGVEQNTARGVKEAPVMTGMTSVEYAPATDAPPVEGFKTYGEI